MRRRLRTHMSWASSPLRSFPSFNSPSFCNLCLAMYVCMDQMDRQIRREVMCPFKQGLFGCDTRLFLSLSFFNFDAYIQQIFHYVIYDVCVGFNGIRDHFGQFRSRKGSYIEKKKGFIFNETFRKSCRQQESLR